MTDYDKMKLDSFIWFLKNVKKEKKVYKKDIASEFSSMSSSFYWKEGQEHIVLDNDEAEQKAREIAWEHLESTLDCSDLPEFMKHNPATVKYLYAMADYSVQVDGIEHFLEINHKVEYDDKRDMYILVDY